MCGSDRTLSCWPSHETLGALVRRHLLDPRSAEEAGRRPIRDSVNIPLSELPRRVHELPPRAEVVRVAGPAELVSETVAWLREGGRQAEPAQTCTCGSSPQSGEIGRLWDPTAFLADVLPQLARGAALDLACGTGRDAVYLASCGWDVTAVDMLPDALSLADDLAQRYAAARPIRWIQYDLEADLPKFDQPFDLIVVFRYLHRPLLAELKSWLSPGGSFLCETFTSLHRQRHGKPARQAYVLQPGELRGLLEGFELRHYSEAWRGDIHTARAWAVSPHCK